MSTVGRVSSILSILCLLSCAQAERGQQGDACTTDDDCAQLPCIDGICCENTCDGICDACNLPDSLGTCTPIPDGDDPDAECGPLNCAGYHANWVDDTCFFGGNVTADQAACGGDSACRSAEVECGLAPLGEPQIVCDELCQTPNTDTCVGTTAGACNNLDQGMETCGFGGCQVTVPRCVDGVSNECVPDNTASSPEVCNGLDDDCDGLVDDDWAEPNEDCSEFQNLLEIYSNQAIDYGDLSVNEEGDIDYFRITATEMDDMCSCCDTPTCSDEDFEMYLYLTVPPGVGSYVFCTGPTCDTVDDRCIEVPAGQNRTLVWSFDGTCESIDSFEVFVRLYGDNAPGHSCTPYQFSYEFVTGCFGVD